MVIATGAPAHLLQGGAAVIGGHRRQAGGKTTTSAEAVISGLVSQATRIPRASGLSGDPLMPRPADRIDEIAKRARVTNLLQRDHIRVLHTDQVRPARRASPHKPARWRQPPARPAGNKFSTFQVITRKPPASNQHR
jgi:hypothetical protein